MDQSQQFTSMVTCKARSFLAPLFELTALRLDCSHLEKLGKPGSQFFVAHVSTSDGRRGSIRFTDEYSTPVEPFNTQKLNVLLRGLERTWYGRNPGSVRLGPDPALKFRSQGNPCNSAYQGCVSPCNSKHRSYNTLAFSFIFLFTVVAACAW